MDWQTVLRTGILPQMGDDELTALRLGLERDDERLIQGNTCNGKDGKCEGEPVAACLIGYAGWKGKGLKTRTQVESYFADVALRADSYTRVPLCIHHFTNAYDPMPRPQMLAEMLPEVTRETARRAESRSASLAG